MDLSGCPSGKVPYRSQAKAQSAARAIGTGRARRGRSAGVVPYLCEDCSQWHLAAHAPRIGGVRRTPR